MFGLFTVGDYASRSEGARDCVVWSVISYMKSFHVHTNCLRLKYEFGNLYRFLTRPLYQSRVPLHQITNIFGVRFGENSSHFMVRYLESHHELKSNISKSFAIAQYHKSFSPTSLGESLGLPLENDLPLFVYPWGVFGTGASKSNKNVLNSRFCGPSERELVSTEEEALLELHDVIKRDGYRPTEYPNRFIQGVWLVREDGRRKFVVLQGNHRVAVMSYLKFEKVAVRNDMFKIGEVREKDIDNWVMVRNEHISRKEAKLVFDCFFTS